jgi:3-oxoacyl-[acyl-carrier protein] reductase
MIVSLEGKRAVVCGSTQGIGKAIAEEFAKAGATVTLVARDEEALKEVRDGLAMEKKQKHNYIVADFSRPEELRKKIDYHVSQNGSAHILVNNTGGPKGGEIINANVKQFEDAFKMHLVCNQIMTQALADGMMKEGYGRIINIISTSVKQPLKGLGVSNTIRGAVASWSKTMSNELGKYGITVNNILPGATMTGRLESIIKSKSEKSGKSEAEIEREMRSEIPAGRFAEAVELAYAAVFLASDKAGYINGVSIAVDGGRTGCL